MAPLTSLIQERMYRDSCLDGAARCTPDATSSQLLPRPVTARVGSRVRRRVAPTAAQHPVTSHAANTLAFWDISGPARAGAGSFEIAGAAPATAVKLYISGSYERLGASVLQRSEDNPVVHAQAAVLAGIATATAMNLIWLVKTRLQLDNLTAEGGGARQYRGNLDCIRQVLRKEGLFRLYCGLRASYLGTVEMALHLVPTSVPGFSFRRPCGLATEGEHVLHEIGTLLSTTDAVGLLSWPQRL